MSRSAARRYLAAARSVPIPLSVALPWMFLALLSPIWFYYGIRAVLILRTAIYSVAFPASFSLKALSNDMIVFWPASRLILTPNVARIYDSGWFELWRSIHMAPGIASYLDYIYPPPALLLLLPLVPFGYTGGFLVWTLLMVVPGVLLLRRSGLEWPVLLFALISAAGTYTIWLGQLGILTGALLVGGLFLVRTHNLKAGLLLGLLIIKPQAGLLAPVVLLAAGEYGILAVAGLVAITLCAGATLLGGVQIWPSFLLLGLKDAHRILIAPFPTVYEVSGASVFWMFRSFGSSVGVAGLVQSVSAITSLIFCWRAWRRTEGDVLELIILTCSLTLLVTPYAYTDDMWALSLMIGWVAYRRRRLDFTDACIWAWPGICPFVSMGLHLELTPLILILSAARAWKRLDGIGTTAPACYPAPI